MQNAIFPHILADYNSALKINPYLAQAYYNQGQTSKERSLICRKLLTCFYNKETHSCTKMRWI
ncbi:hypothetical protein [Fischerella thermalis]|uniref:hypothetical protein n=1 Tax=Fischerella thermalis TaxID=372787 RepID=UPI0015E07450|nr:hypothetical protein [Fischerella thermalis]MBF1988764.1 hypothetical protein [Fischerella thermalis M58_A2018_009]MBF2060840.1 hypothetical protein [Fischerella thermalis M66_A2018_004]MBF2071776.1 hypothetical protein [Fischerella thermalis M48_A2018_028]